LFLTGVFSFSDRGDWKSGVFEEEGDDGFFFLRIGWVPFLGHPSGEDLLLQVPFPTSPAEAAFFHARGRPAVGPGIRDFAIVPGAELSKWIGASEK